MHLTTFLVKARYSLTLLRAPPEAVHTGSTSKVTNQMNLPTFTSEGVDRDLDSCKVWLTPVALASSLGFKARELREIERLVSMNRAILLKAWEEFHG